MTATTGDTDLVRTAHEVVRARAQLDLGDAYVRRASRVQQARFDLQAQGDERRAEREHLEAELEAQRDQWLAGAAVSSRWKPLLSTFAPSMPRSSSWVCTTVIAQAWRPILPMPPAMR